MALITKFEEVINTGLRISNVDRAAALPDFDAAEREYLLPYLGKALLAALKGNSLTAELALLLPLVCKPLAAFGYWQDLPLMHTRITDAGVRRTSNEKVPAAYRWEYEEAKNYLEERAYSSLEALLSFLDDNRDDYPEWNDDAAVQARMNAIVFKSGKEFSDCYKLHHPHRSFHALIPIVLDIERMYIEPAVTKDLLDTYRQRSSTTVLEDEEKQLLSLLQSAIAHLTIAAATERLSCQVTPVGFMVKNTPGSGKTGSGNDGLQQADAEALRRVANNARTQGKKYLAAARNYLNTTASETLFADFFTSELYNPDKLPIIDSGNSTRKIFRFN